MVILIADRFDSSLPERLRELGDVTSDMRRIGDAEILLVRSKTKCTRELLDSAPRLKLIVRGGVGLDTIDQDAAKSLGISVLNTPRASAIAVAELTMSLMLAAASRVVEAHNSMAAGRWEKSELKRTELYGKRLCLVGLGSIGSEVAARAAAFGMKVCGVRRSRRDHPAAHVLSTLEAAVADADYVSLHLPLNDETRGMIDGKVIRRMKEGAVLVNTSRAGCVVADEIAAALTSGRLRSYACDVWSEEPPCPDDPLLHAPNVIMTPHIGANSVENLSRIGEEVYNAVSQFLREHV